MTFVDGKLGHAEAEQAVVEHRRVRHCLPQENKAWNLLDASYE